MRSLLIACCLAFAFMASTPAAAKAASDQEPASPAAAGPSLKIGKPCGNAENVYLCTVVSSDDVGPKYISKNSVKFPKSGTALVTWSGATYCVISGKRTSDPNFYVVELTTEQFIFLALKKNNDPIKYNEPGSASVGDVTTIGVDTSPTRAVTLKRTSLIPVTLTKAFPVKKGVNDFQVSVLGDFRNFASFSPYCNVNGGAMTIQFYPD